MTGVQTCALPISLSGSVGVPGPQGPAGATGPAGPAGEGVPAGGTTGQALVKTSNSDYATGWTTLNLTQYLLKASNLSDLTNVTAARSNLNLGPTVAQVFAGVSGSSGVPFSENAYYSTYDSSFSGFASNQSYYTAVGPGEGGPYLTEFKQVELSKDALSFTYNTFQTNGDLIASYELLLNSEGLTSNRTVGNSWGIGIGGVTFPDSTVQSTAFPGFNNAALTGNPTAPTPATSDNDTSIATTAYVKAQAFGDRYLTSSTTSLTINNGNKTLTVGTGLSYTPTQNVTISYDASHHMHGEVLTYNSGTGVMTVDVNHNTGSGTYTAWVVNVGGVTPQTSVAWGAITGTLSAQTDLQTALDAKAPLASPTFTGTPSLPTGTIGVTQTAGNNTTALATTAFVTASNPDASDTVKGHVELATNAEVITGTSTSLVSSLSNIPAWVTRPELRSLAHISSTAITGSGLVSTGNVAWGMREMYLNTLATGRASFRYGLPAAAGVLMSKNDKSKIDFSKKIWLSGKCCLALTVGATSYLGDANTMARITLGGYTSTTTGDMTVMGIGFKKVGGVSSNIVLTVHNGTSLTDVTSSKAVAADETIDWVIYSDGTGNVTLYVDGVQIATTSSGPTGLGANFGCIYNEQIEATTTPGVRGSIQATGGYMFIEL